MNKKGKNADFGTVYLLIIMFLYVPMTPQVNNQL